MSLAKAAAVNGCSLIYARERSFACRAEASAQAGVSSSAFRVWSAEPGPPSAIPCRRLVPRRLGFSGFQPLALSLQPFRSGGKTGVNQTKKCFGAGFRFLCRSFLCQVPDSGLKAASLREPSSLCVESRFDSRLRTQDPRLIAVQSSPTWSHQIRPNQTWSKEKNKIRGGLVYCSPSPAPRPGQREKGMPHLV